MVLPGAHGPWAPGSVADCRTSDGACGQASTQSLAQQSQKAARHPGHVSGACRPIAGPPTSAAARTRVLRGL